MPVCPDCKSANFGQLSSSHFFVCKDCKKLFELVEVKENGKTKDEGKGV